ncbi:MAG: NUDIX domain-containing protein [Candidatus Staskawiczbacteria bacterium]|nr:NUDIX domain-containing protein [Candidatus Staskawiczbacteria bacterium]
MPREKSAGAIIYRMENGVPHYLLLHYFSGHWEFPKGHIEKGETEEETVKREAFEETGINDLKIIPGFKKYIKYFFRQYKENVSDAERRAGKTPWIFKLVVFFIAETKIKDVKISHEHKGFLWLPIEEAIKKTTFKNSKLLLKEANEFVVSQNL